MKVALITGITGQDGIEKTYSWFLENIENIKEVKM